MKQWMTWSLIGMMACATVFPAAATELENGAAVAARVQASVGTDAAPAWMNPELPPNIANDVRGKGANMAERLGLEGDKSEAIANLIATHYGRVWAWHQENDERLDEVWAEWDAARVPPNKDEHKALVIAVEKLDPIYATFAPQINHLMKGLRAELTEEQVQQVLDRFTPKPGMMRTYKVFEGYIPQATDEQRAIMLDRLKQAQLESMVAWSDDEVVKIFKKYKLRNEASIDWWGYDYRASRERYFSKDNN